MSRGTGSSGVLPPGVIFDLARSAGVIVPLTGPKRRIRCPLPGHEDTTPSAFLSERNVFYCSICTPGGGWSARKFALVLGLQWPPEISGRPAVHPSPECADGRPFRSDDAATIWGIALERARDDRCVEADRAVYEYVNRRGLMPSWEESAFGIVASEMPLPDAIRHWPEGGYRLVAPLYNGAGRVTNIQARAITQINPKTRFPAGSRAAGTLFADGRGQQVLQGVRTGPRQVLLGEGLTDHLALTIASPIPVLSAPGTGMAEAAIGPWAAGIEVYLALDRDPAGEAAVRGAARAAHQHRARRVHRVVWPGNAKDACDVLTALGEAGLAQFLEETVRGEGAGHAAA